MRVRGGKTAFLSVDLLGIKPLLNIHVLISMRKTLDAI